VGDNSTTCCHAMRRILATGAALLLGGCGVDYQKCEAINRSIISAQTHASNVRSPLIRIAEAPYKAKDCSKANLKKIIKEEGLTDNDYMLDFMKSDCESRIYSKYITQISEELSKNREVINAEYRVKRVIDDYKWNRCM